MSEQPRFSTEEIAKRTGLSPRTIRDRYRNLAEKDSRGRLSFSKDAWLKIESELALEELCKKTHPITAETIAKNTGRHLKTIQTKYSKHGKIVNRRLCFKHEVAEAIYKAEGLLSPEHTITRTDAAKRLGCHPDTVSRLLPNKGRRSGHKILFREKDIIRLERERQNATLISYHNVQEELSITDMQLLYLLRGRTAKCEGYIYGKDQADWRPDIGTELQFPYPDMFKQEWPWWYRSTIEPWLMVFKEDPGKFLTPESHAKFDRLGNASHEHHEFRQFFLRFYNLRREKSNRTDAKHRNIEQTAAFFKLVLEHLHADRDATT